MNNNRDYVNYITRHLETLNTIIDQMESINRNMYSLTTRPPSRQTSSGLGAVGKHLEEVPRYHQKDFLLV
jgi:hypothetical protein